MGKQSEYAATNGEVKRWGITQIAATFAALGGIGAFGMGFLSTAVEAGGKGHFATVEQVQAVTQKVETLDAGMAKKEDVQRLEKKVDALDDKMDELKNILIKQKGGK